jgi:hypothetical protein
MSGTAAAPLPEENRVGDAMARYQGGEPEWYQLSVWGLGVSVVRTRQDGLQTVTVSVDTESAPAHLHNPDGTPRIIVEVNGGPVFDGVPATSHKAWIVRSGEDGYVEAFATLDEAMAMVADHAQRGLAVAVRNFETRTPPGPDTSAHIVDEYLAQKENA